MTVTHYIGFDVHKKSVSYCVKDAAGGIAKEGKLQATREALQSPSSPSGASSPTPESSLPNSSRPCASRIFPSMTSSDP